MASSAIRSVIIEAIDPRQMRYRTAGDWFFKEVGDELCIQVADLGDWRYNCLVAIHELIEVLLCTNAGISQKLVDRFDFAHEDEDDPGSHPEAPYQKEHLIAMGMEMMLAASLGIQWRTYADAIEKVLEQTPRTPRKNLKS